MISNDEKGKTKEDLLFISIIIPTYQRLDCLKNLLKQLVRQNYSKFEILIIDQTPYEDEGLLNLIKSEESRIRYFYLKEACVPKAWNKGLKEARGEVLLFMDDDVEISDGIIEAHSLNYSDLSIGAVAGQVLNTQRRIRSTRHPLSFFPRVGWAFFPFNFDRRIYVEGAVGCNFSFRKSIGIKTKGFDENFTQTAHHFEADFCYRVLAKNLKIIFDPNASLIHIGNPSGGIRSWSDFLAIRVYYDLRCTFYMLMKNVRIYYWPIFLLATARRSLIHKQNFYNPARFILCVFYLVIAFMRAAILYSKGPLYSC